MKELNDALRQEEEDLDAAAWQRIQHYRVVPVLGDLVKQLTGKKKTNGQFEAAAVGHRHVHLAGPDHCIQQVSNQPH